MAISDERTFKHRDEGVKYVFDIEKPLIEQSLTQGEPDWPHKHALSQVVDDYWCGDDTNGWVVFYKIDQENCIVHYVSYDEMYGVIEHKLIHGQWAYKSEARRLFNWYKKFEMVDDRWSHEAQELLNENYPEFDEHLARRYNR